MLNLDELQFSELIGLGRRLHHLRDDCDSMEAAAQRIAETLFHELCDEEGKPACVLTRLFVTLPVDLLEASLKKRAVARLPVKERADCSKVMCLTLLGSMGVEPAWTNRQGSSAHAVIPLMRPEDLGQLPMIAKLLEQLQIEPSLVLEPQSHPSVPIEPQLYQVFHLEPTDGAAPLPAQAEFVQRYGIDSVFGFGGLLPGGSLFAVLMFSRVRISPDQLALFRPLALYTKLAFLPFVGGPRFAGDARPLNLSPEITRSQILTLNALLEAKETLAQNQTRILENQCEDLLCYKLVSDHSSDAIVFLNRDARILFANSTACQKLGYAEPDLLSLTLPAIEPSNDLSKYQAVFEAAQTGPSSSMETEYRRKDGTAFPVEIVYTAIRFQDRPQLLSVARDISKHKTAEEARVIKERMNEALIQGDLDAIVVFSAEGEIQVFNPSAQHLFGYQEQEVLGQSFTRLIHEEGWSKDPNAVKQIIQNKLITNLGKHTEWTGRRKNGEHFPMEMALTGINLPGRQLFLASIRDVSERTKLQLRLAQAEKLASLGLLGAGMLHEINNPLAFVVSNLAVIDDYAHGLMNMVDANEPVREELKVQRPELIQPVVDVAKVIDLPYIRQNLGPILASTRKGVTQIAELVKSLRGFALMDRPVIESVGLSELVTSSLEMAREQLSSHKIVIERDDIACPRILCVFAQIHRVVFNLLVNAQQAIEEANRPEGWIRIRTYPEPPWGVIEITDNGVGISPEVMPRLFEPFFTTKPKEVGTGLGLAICLGIVQEHQGRIEVKTEFGQGTTFRVLLPIAGRMMVPGTSTS